MSRMDRRYEMPAFASSWIEQDTSRVRRIEVGAHCIDLDWPWWQTWWQTWVGASWPSTIANKPADTQRTEETHMATKKIGVSKVKPVSEAIPLGTKTKKRGKGVLAPRPVDVPLSFLAEAEAEAEAQRLAGTYADYPLLADLPQRIAAQQELKATITIPKDLIEKEKAARQAIEALMIASALPEDDEHVTCGDYDVRRIEKDGQASINENKLKAVLIDYGFDAETILKIVEAATEKGEPTSYVTVGLTRAAKDRRRFEAHEAGMDQADEEGVA